MTQVTLEEQSFSEFKPSERQEIAKYKLHTHVPAHVIAELTPESLVPLRSFFYPIHISEIIQWHLDSKMFWFWFTIKNEHVFKLNSMRKLAVKTVHNILKGQVADSKLANTQLKAAQMLLEMSDKPPTHVTRNTLNVGSTRDIPRELAKKSPLELEEELKRITAENNVS